MNFRKTLGAALALGISAAAAAEGAGAGTAAEAAAEAKGAFQQAVYQTRTLLFADELSQLLTIGNIVKAVTGSVAIVIFYVLFRLVRRLIKRAAEKKLEAHTASIITKFLSYIFYVGIGVYILSLFGINVSAIWGAAGVAGLAVGFAAQTSVSNLISGLFVLTEKTMKIGDFIEVDGVSGTVDEIGLLSVKIHTLDNQLIRIPNSTIINTKLMNYATYDLRRFSFPLEVSYDTDPQAALDAAMAVPPRCPSAVLDNPDYAPVALFTGLGESGVNLSLNVWFKRQDFVKIRNEVFAGFLNICKERGIEIPYSKLDVNIMGQNAV